MLFVTVAVTICERRTGRTVRGSSLIAEIPFGSGNIEFQVTDWHVLTRL
jgi:hypothetical protein